MVSSLIAARLLYPSRKTSPPRRDDVAGTLAATASTAPLMTDNSAHAIASPPQRRRVWATLRRVGLLRLFVQGFILLIALGLTVAFHFEFRNGRIGLPYSPLADWVG